MKLKNHVLDWQGFVGSFKTSGALLVGNSVLVLFGIIGNGDLRWRLAVFGLTLVIGVIFLLIGSLIQRK